VTVGAGMVASVSDEKTEEGRVYSPSEKDLNTYVRKHFPEWGCAEI
jgi:sulfate adenylyltransferase subunit 1